MNVKIDREFEQRLKSDPTAEHEVIVRAATDLDELIASLPPNLDVKYTYRLIHSIAVTGRASDIRSLTGVAAVKTIEPVKSVKSC